MSPGAQPGRTDMDDVRGLAAMAREVLDEVRYVVLSTVDEDGRTRTSPVYFTPHRGPADSCRSPSP